MAQENIIPFRLVAELDVTSVKSAVKQASGQSIDVAMRATNAEQFTRQVGAGSAAMQASAVAARAAAAGQDALAKSTVTANEAVRVAVSGGLDASKILENLGNQAGLAAKRFLAMSVVATTMAGVSYAIKGSVTEAIAFEKTMAQVAQVSGLAKSQLQALAGQIGDISRELGVSGNELAQASIQMKKLGLDAQQTDQALQAIARASLSVNFDGVKGSTEAAIVAMRQFRVEAGQLDAALGSINAVSNKFNVNAKDITEAIRVAGSSFKQAGGDMNELIAIFASAKGTTEEAAGGIASSIRLVFNRIQRNDVAIALKDLGVSLRYTREEADRLGNTRLENQFVGTLEAVKRLSGALKDLQTTDPRYINVLEQLGGARNVSRVIPLLQQVNDAERALVVAQTGAITTANAQEAALGTLSGRAGQVAEQFGQLGKNIVGSSEFQAFARASLDLASGLAKVLEFARPLLPLLATLATIKIAENIGGITSAFARRFSSAPTINNTEIRRNVGGPIPGVGNTDSVHALLTPGEFVINKQAAQNIGYDNLHQINAQRFAAGGLVPQRRGFFGKLSPAALFSGLSDEDSPQKRGGYTESEIDALTSYVNPNRDSNDITTSKPGYGDGDLEQFWNYRLKKRIELGLPITEAPVGVRVDSFTARLKKAEAGATANLRKFAEGGYVGISESRHYVKGGKVLPLSEEEKAIRYKLYFANRDRLHRSLSRKFSGTVDPDDALEHLDKSSIDRQYIEKFDPSRVEGDEFSEGDLASNKALQKKFANYLYRQAVTTTRKAYSKGQRTKSLDAIAGSSGDPFSVAEEFRGGDPDTVRLKSTISPSVVDVASRGGDASREQAFAVLQAAGLDIDRANATAGEKRSNTAAIKRVAKQIGSSRSQNQIADILGGVSSESLSDVFAGKAAPPAPVRSPVAAESVAKQTVAQGAINNNPIGQQGPVATQHNLLIAALNQLTSALRDAITRIKGGAELGKTRDIIEGEVVGSRPGKPETPGKVVHFVGGQKQIGYEGGPAGLLTGPKQPLLLTHTPEQQGPPHPPGRAVYLGPGGEAPQITYNPFVGSPSGDATHNVPSGLSLLGKPTKDIYGFDNSPIIPGQPVEKFPFGIPTPYRLQKPQVDHWGERIPLANQDIGITPDRYRFEGEAPEVYGPAEPTNLRYRLRRGFRSAKAAVGNFASNLPGAVGRGLGSVVGEESGLNQAVGSSLGRYSGLGLAAAVAAPYLAQVGQHFGGTAEQAVTGGNETGFKAAQGASGLVSGVTLGATIGSVVPGVGTAVGAVAGGVVGGVVGVASALKDAERDIRTVKIGRALSDFSDQLHETVIGTVGTNPGVARKNLNTYLSETTAKNSAEATSFFGSFNVDQFSNLQQKSLRQDIGTQLPDIVQSLNKQADQITKSHLGLSTEELAKKVQDGGDGFNRELLTLVAQIRKVPLDTVLGELKKNIETSRFRANAETANLAGRQGGEANVNAFGRLLLNVEAASSSMDDLKRKLLVLGDAFDGAAQVIKVSAHADNFSGLGRNDNGILKPLNIIRQIGGAEGQRFFQAGAGANAVARVFGSSLSGAYASNPLTDDDLATRTRKNAVRSLGFTEETLPQNIKNALNVAISGLTDKIASGGGLHAIGKELKVDPTKLTEEVLGPLTEAMKKVGPEIAKRIEAQANFIVEGIHTFQKRLEAQGGLQDRSVFAGVQALRAGTQVVAERGGFGGNYLDQLSVPQLEAGRQFRQERLTGFRGADAFNSQLIGRALDNAKGRVSNLESQQQKVFDKTGGQGPEFKAFVDQLAAARAQAENFRQALKHGADGAENLAVIQEKLAKLSQERGERLSLAERVRTASPEEQVRLTRAAQNLRASAARGNLGNLSGEDAKGVFDLLGQLGNTPLRGLGLNGNPTGNDLKRQFLERDQIPGISDIANLNPENKREENGLQDALVARTKEMEQNLKQLAQDYREENSKFFDKLAEAQKGFFDTLAKNLSTEAISRAQNAVGGKAAELGDLRRLNTQADVLRNAGIRSDDDLRRYKGLQGDLTQLAEARKSVTDANGLRALGSRSGVNSLFKNVNKEDALDYTYLFPRLGGETKGGLTQALKEKGFTNSKDIEAILSETDKGIRFKAQEATPFLDRPTVGQNEDIIKKALEDAIKKVAPEAAKREQDTFATNPALRRVRREGFDPDALLNAGPKLGEAVKAFDGKSFDTLDKSLQTVTAQFQNLSKVIEALQGPAQARAGGGPIFQARGTDTVPAMLTPGEFVVNASAAQANLGLLHRINGSKGASHLADGGPVDDWQVPYDTSPMYSYAEPKRPNRNLETLAGLSPEIRKKLLARVAKWHSSGGVIYRADGGGVPDAPDDADAETQRKWLNAKFAEANERASDRKRRNTNSQIDWDFVKKNVAAREGQGQAQAAPAADAAPAAAPGIDGANLTANLRLFAAQDPNSASAGFLAHFQAQKFANEQRVGIRGQAKVLSDIANAKTHDLTDEELAELRPHRQAARRGLAGLAQRDAYFAKFAASALYGHSVNSTIAGFQRRQLFGGLGDYGQGAINSSVSDVEAKYKSQNDLLNPDLQAARRQFLPHFATGGIVPGVGSSDSVPSLLTPGEGVLTKGAVASVGGAAGVQALNSGGVVKTNYLAGGGQASGGADFGAFSEAASKLSDNLNSFASTANHLADALNQMPRTLNFSGQWQGTLTLNGAEVLARLQPEFQKMVEQQIQQKVTQIFKEKMPEAGLST